MAKRNPFLSLQIPLRPYSETNFIQTISPSPTGAIFTVYPLFSVQTKVKRETIKQGPEVLHFYIDGQLIRVLPSDGKQVDFMWKDQSFCFTIDWNEQCYALLVSKSKGFYFQVPFVSFPARKALFINDSGMQYKPLEEFNRDSISLSKYRLQLDKKQQILTEEDELAEKVVQQTLDCS
jgi:hypothetical protein